MNAAPRSADTAAAQSTDHGAFRLDQVDAIRQHYVEHGYVRVGGVVPDAKIDAFLAAYEGIKHHPRFVYYSQSLQVAIRPTVSADGYIKESMQNASRLAFFPDFSRRFKDCLFDDAVADALTAVTGYREHVSWQNMFFDQSTGTIEHQDSWYLDTAPAGGLVGVWFALEDIHPDSGPFFVAPGTHTLGLIDRAQFPNHDDYVAHVKTLLTTDTWETRPMALAKGEILLWHPYLIHGAFAPTDPSHSRKSLTSHFYPYGMTAKDTEQGKLLSIYRHSSPRPTSNPRLKEAYRFSDYVYNLMVYGLYARRRLKDPSGRIQMRRELYQ